MLILKIWFFINTIPLVNRFLRFYLSSQLKLLKLKRVEIMNALIWDLIFPTVSLGQFPIVDCDPRWLKFLICRLERERRQRICNQDYFKLSQPIHLKRVIDTVDNFTDCQENSNLKWNLPGYKNFLGIQYGLYCSCL